MSPRRIVSSRQVQTEGRNLIQFSNGIYQLCLTQVDRLHPVDVLGARHNLVNFERERARYQQIGEPK